MRPTDSMNSRSFRTVLRLAVLAAACLPAATADAQTYVYDGYNIVTMPGSACRTERFASEVSLVSHDRITRARAPNQSYTRLLCPIPRRGTSHYGSPFTSLKAKLQSVVVRGFDGGSMRILGCSVFITDMFNQTTSWGPARYLCSNAAGCPAVSTPGSYTGANTLELSPPTNGSSLDTANFGLTCTLPFDSSIDSYETFVRPND